jgi:hypothetical protein
VTTNRASAASTTISRRSELKLLGSWLDCSDGFDGLKRRRFSSGVFLCARRRCHACILADGGGHEATVGARRLSSRRWRR